MLSPNLQSAVNVLADLRRRGLLVPVLGAGMSIAGENGGPTWPEFLNRLSAKAGAEPPHSGSIASAWTAMRRLRAQSAHQASSPEGVASVISDCVGAAAVKANPTPQLRALATYPWPLVITMNYDGGYEAARCQAAGGDVGVRTLTRSPQDCWTVARALSTPKDPICWAIHGSVPELGGTTAEAEARQRQGLRDLVVSGDDYRKALHAEPHFRHTISAVVRQRALLFVGTGLSDEHINDILDEDAQHLGAPALPRFAILPSGSNLDPHLTAFMRVERGITLLEIPLDQIPEVLRSIATDEPPQIGPAQTIPTVLLEHARPPQSKTSVHIRTGELSSQLTPPGERTLVALSAGIAQGGGWHVASWIGSKFGSVTPKPRPTGSSSAGNICSTNIAGLWLIQSQRSCQSDNYERDFDVIMSGVQAMCSEAAHAQQNLTINLIGGGKGKKYPAAWHLIAMLAAIRRWSKQNPEAELDISIVLAPPYDRSVIDELRGPRMCAAAILSGPPWPVWIDASRVGDDRHRYVLVDPWSTTVRDLLNDIGFPSDLRVKVVPESTGSTPRADAHLSEIGVLPGSTIEIG